MSSNLEAVLWPLGAVAFAMFCVWSHAKWEEGMGNYLDQRMDELHPKSKPPPRPQLDNEGRIVKEKSNMITKIAKINIRWGGDAIIAEVKENYAPSRLGVRMPPDGVILDRSEWDEFVSEVERIWPPKED